MSIGSAISDFAKLRVAVVGDLMMDEYVWGEASRVSPESPVLVVDVSRESAVPGGAANVAANVAALGATAKVFGAVGDDPKGRELVQQLREHGSDVSGIVVDPTRPTTRKTRVVAQNQQVLRVDREKSHPLSGKVASSLVELVLQVLDDVDVVLVSDYAKGVVNPDTVPHILQAAKARGVKLAANGKPTNASCYLGADLLTFNLSEAAAVDRDHRFKTNELPKAGGELRERLGVQNLVVTRGAEGLAVFSADSQPLLVPAKTVEVYDVAGAGDTVVAALSLGLASGLSMADSAELATLAASVAVGKVGVAPVTSTELIAACVGP